MTLMTLSRSRVSRWR